MTNGTNIESNNNTESGATSDELLQLKKDLAEEIVDKLLQKDPSLLGIIFEKRITDYLVSDGSLGDVVFDELFGSVGEELGLISQTLKDCRESLKEIREKSDIETKRREIFNKIDGIQETSTDTKESSNATPASSETNTEERTESIDGNNNEPSSEKEGLSEIKNNNSSDEGKYETSNPDTTKVDKSGFTPGPYPFKHITTPYKGISSYRVDKIKLDPLIGFSQLSLKGTEGSLTTLKVKDQEEHFATKTAGYKKNNPCNVSPFEGDVGRSGSSKVADGQNHSKYNSMEDGLASFMRLMRQDRYRNKSIQGINCSGMQGIYKDSEPDSLKALRITRITHACEHLNVSPFQRLNTDDKETMMAWAQETAIRESGSYFSRKTLERAYEKAFG